MIEISATELQSRTGSVIEQAMQSPVCITRNKRPVVTLLSTKEYERLLELEDAYWGEMATRSMASESVSAEEVKTLLDKLGA